MPSDDSVETAEDSDATVEQETEGASRDGVDEPRPIGRGAFGDIYDAFKGKAKEAFDFLLKKKSGYLVGVFHRDEIGDIDLAYGEAHNPYKGKGLAHIIKKHVETLKDFNSTNDAIETITDVIENGEVKTGSVPNTYDIEKGDYRVVVASDENGNWVLTAFDYVNSAKKKKKGAATTLTLSQPSDEAGAVTSSLSADKGTKKNGAKQEKTEKNAQQTGEKVAMDLGKALSKPSGLRIGNSGKNAVDIHKFVEKDKEELKKHPGRGGVLYENGVAVATNGHVLVAVNTDYGKENEGKIVNKSGDTVEGKFPNWESILPTTGERVDKDDFLRAVDEAKAAVGKEKHPNALIAVPSSHGNVMISYESAAKIADVVRKTKNAEVFVGNLNYGYALVSAGDGTVALAMQTLVDESDTSRKFFHVGNEPRFSFTNEEQEIIDRAEADTDASYSDTNVVDKPMFSIRNDNERKAAENAYNFAQKLRPGEDWRYAVVNMERPGAVPLYEQKRSRARSECKYFNELHWGNYKLLDLDKTFDENAETLPGEFPEEYEVKYSFIGEKGAKTADHAEEVTTRLDNLAVAREMEEAKKDAKAIKMATGWERGADGKWRYEIEDITLKAPEEWIKKKELKLSDVVDGDNDIFKAYPELKQVKVVCVNKDASVGGFYSDETNTIYVNEKSSLPYDEVFVHEIQHAIQYIEGFEHGGSPEMFHDLSEEDRRFVQFDKLVREKFGKADEKTLFGILDGTTDEYRDFVSSLGEDYSRILKSLRATKKYAAKDFMRYYDRDVEENSKPSAYDQYQSLSGEVESRNVQKRMGMTPEERRASLASETEDVAREDQIFLFGEGGESHMGSRTNKNMAKIGKYFDGRNMSNANHAIIDVFSGKRDNQTVAFVDKDGNKHRMFFFQGHELKAGSKHAIYRHYGEKEGWFNEEEITKVYDVLTLGNRSEDNDKIEYAYQDESNGIEYTVAAEKDGNKERFITFYTNRKAPKSSLQNTQQSAQADQDAFRDAKIANSSETANNSEENLQGEGRFSFRTGEYNPRAYISPVRGEWTKEKILRRLKDMGGSHKGYDFAAKLISEFDSPEELAEHMFYHGTYYGGGSLKPSIMMSDRDIDRYGGGGYGQKYWGISVSRSKKIASNFSTHNGVRIYPIILAKNAKVIEMPELQDAADLEDHIVDLWEQGVDAVKIGDWNDKYSEQELCVLNPRAIVNIDSSDYYKYFRLGHEENPLHIIDKEGIEKLYVDALHYNEQKKNAPHKPKKPSRFVGDNFDELKDEAEYQRELEEYNERLSEFESSQEYKDWEKAQREAYHNIRFSIRNGGEMPNDVLHERINQYDENNGTELGRFVDFIERGRVLNEGENPHFKIGKAGNILQHYGIKGNIFASTETESERRHTRNADHGLTPSEWVEAMESVNTPLAITRYRGNSNRYRVYTFAIKNGKSICLGMDVKNNENAVEISGIEEFTDIRTAFGRDIEQAIRNEDILYPEGPNTEEQIRQNFAQSSAAHNSQLYEQNSVSGANVANSSETANNSGENLQGEGRFSTVYHGSGADFDAFDHSHMGEGEGAQAYGWGTYVTEVEGIGRTYAENNPGTTDVSELEYDREKAQEDIAEKVLARYGNIDCEFEVMYNGAGGFELFDVPRDEATLTKFREYFKEHEDEWDDVTAPEDYDLSDEYDREQFARSVESSMIDYATNIAHDYDHLWSEEQRILYTVDIPDDNGSNYLEWTKEYSVDDVDSIIGRLLDVAAAKEKEGNLDEYEKFRDAADHIGEWVYGDLANDFFDKLTGENIYRKIAGSFADYSESEASNLLSEAGFAGIKYPAENRTGGRKDGAKNYVIFKESDAKIEDKLRFSVVNANKTFNEELDEFTLENADNFVFDLGRPSGKLIAAGVADMPIRLYGSKLAKKIRSHGFSAKELKNLPLAMENPIAVFDNLERKGNRSVLTELKTADGNFLVTIDLGKGLDADFDIVSSVFGKKGNSVVNWINKGFLKYVDKEKALNYLRLSAPIAEASNKSELNSATKVIQDFENPKVEDENIDDTPKFSITSATDFANDISEKGLGGVLGKEAVERFADDLYMNNADIRREINTRPHPLLLCISYKRQVTTSLDIICEALWV